MRRCEHPVKPIDPLHVPLVAPHPLHLLEVAHVAHRLSASPDFVYQLIKHRKLAAIRLGTRWRVDPLDLQAFIDAQRVPRDSREG